MAQRMGRLWLAAMAGLVLVGAAEEAPIAVVDGSPVTVAHFETELLQREGRVRLREILEGRLKELDWSALTEDTVLALPMGQPLTRREVADELERRQGPEVLDELIKQRLVEEALVREGVVCDAACLEAEWQRRERQLSERIQEEKGPGIQADLAMVIQNERGLDKAGYLALPEVRLEAMLNKWVIEVTPVKDEILRRDLSLHPDRWGQAEAVDLSVITIPFRTVDIDGTAHVDPEHRRNLPQTMAGLHARLVAGDTAFARLWALFGKPYDPGSVDGRVGWTGRDGRPLDRPDGRVLPAEVATAVFAVDPTTLPRLLAPIVHASGVDLVRVEAWRPAKVAEFAALREQLRRAWLERHLAVAREQAMARLLKLGLKDYGAARQVLEGRPLRDELLRRDGLATAQDLLERRYDGVAWAALRDDQTAVLELPALSGRPGFTIRRIDLLVDLLERKGAEVRTDLVRLRLFEQALVDAGIAPTAEIVEAEWQRWDPLDRRRWGESLREDPAFLHAACLHAYILRLTEVPVATLRAWYEANRDRFEVEEAVDLAIIHGPKPFMKLAGQAVVDERNAAKLERLLRSERELIATGKHDFAAVWALLGRVHDPRAAHGRVGWVRRDRSMETPGLRPLSASLVETAFREARQGGLPRLLPLLETGEGWALVRVEGHRPERRTDFDRQREEIRRAWLEEHLAEAAKRFGDDLLQEADIVWGELGDLIFARREVQRTTLPGPAP